MSSWPSKRKKSGRKHIYLGAGDIGGGDKRGTGKKISSGKIRAKQKAELRRAAKEILGIVIDQLIK